MILATKSSTPIIGQLATVMGWIMDGIYRLLNIFGIQNIGLCIVIFSILIYALMTPLQIKQQKFSKLSAIMQPELQKIQKKYKGKNNDTAAMQKMQEETQAVYQKYGVSPTGSCVQLAIQFPILMALYQVIYKIPAYVGSVRDILASAVTSITGVNGYTDILQQFITDNKMTRVQLIMDGSKATSNSVTDFLYALSPSQWKTLAETSQFAGFTDTLNSTAKEISHVQNFFGLNIADQPLTYIKAAFVGGSALLAIVAILIPILAWATQMINLKLMPQAAQQGGDAQQDARRDGDAVRQARLQRVALDVAFLAAGCHACQERLVLGGFLSGNLDGSLAHRLPPFLPGRFSVICSITVSSSWPSPCLTTSPVSTEIVSSVSGLYASLSRL